jgi:TonB family protein
MAKSALPARKTGKHTGTCYPDPPPLHLQGCPVTAILLFILLSVFARAQDEAAPEPLPLLQAPEITEFIQAPYPEEARAEALEATVRLLIEIDERGTVTQVEVLTPAGHGFDEAALEAAKQMRFSPAADETGPVPVAIEFDYGFVLDASGKDGAEPDAGAPQAEQPINLEGTLREMGTRRTLEGVVIRVTAGGVDYEAETTTDKDGRYTFRGAPVGLVAITAAQPGYKPLARTVEVTEAQVTDLTLWIKNRSYRDDEIVIVYRQESDDITRRTVTVREIRRIPGTFGDPVRVIQNLPGAARAPFGSGWMVIRGANPEDTAFYVDGIRVPIIYHLGGYVSILNDDLVGSVDYLPGGYGVEYGRSGGGVIDIKTSKNYPDNFRLEWSTDLLDSGGLVQGRVGKNKRWGLSAAARRSYIDAVIPIFTKDSGFTVKPFWWDYQIKVDDLKKSDGKASVMLFGFGDKLFFGTPEDTAQGSDQDTQGDADVFYTSHRVIGQFEQTLTPDLKLRVSPSLGYDMVGFSLGNEWLYSNKLVLFQARSDLLWTPNKVITLRPGIDVLGGPYNVRLELPDDPNALSTNDPLAEREDFSTEFKGAFVSPEPFLELQLRPLPKPENLLVTPGIRLNTLLLAGGYQIWSVDPRLGVRYSPIEGGTLKTGTGYYHQPPQGPDLGFDQDAIQVDFERTWATEIGWDILAAVAGYDLPRDWGISSRFRYVSGNPYTPYDGGVYDIDNDEFFPYQTQDANNKRLPAYASLDLRVDKLFTFKHWQLETYIDFINVVRGKNAEYIRYNYDYTETAYIRGLPFIPSPGFRAEFEL